MEVPTCRFCLDEANTPRNPLISPCRCIGSVKFVHELCLLRWRAIAPLAIADICQMCRVPYITHYLSFETLPNENGFRYQLLICPYIVTFGLKYLCFMFSGLYGKNYGHAIELIHYHQVFFHMTYAFLFFQKAKIQNTSQYRIQFLKGFRICIIFFHLWFWYLSYTQENLILLYLVDTFLPFYWHTHIQCLQEINELRE